MKDLLGLSPKISISFPVVANVYIFLITLSGRFTLSSSRASTQPLVSVICPTRNGAGHLRAAIDSVLKQDYPRIELIVIDGASTDGTLEILAEYGGELRYVSEADLGQSDAINKGMDLAKGEILAWLNDDDQYVSGAVSAAVEAFVNDKADFVYGDALALDGRGRRYGLRMNVGPGDGDVLVHDRLFIVQPASFWRRAVWDVAGPLRPDLHFALDYDFFMKVAANFEMQYVPYVFAIETIHSGAKTYNGTDERIREIRDVAVEHGAADLPLAFRSEGAAVFAIEALKLYRNGETVAARKALQQARDWTESPTRVAVFTLASALLDGRALPRLRLITNYVVSSRRQQQQPFHGNPDIPLYSLRDPRAIPFPRPDFEVQPKVQAAKSLFIERARPRLGVLAQHPPKPLHHEIVVPPLTTAPLPSITIVTPSFNQGEFIRATAESILDQSYPDLEYIVQDGLSTDGTVEVLSSIDHPDMSWVTEADDGQSNAINRGHSRGAGSVMAWLNSDDILLPGTLAYVGAYFAENPAVDVVYGHRVLIDRSGDEIGRWLLPRHNAAALTWADYIPQETMFWRRSMWDKVGGIDESFRFAMDWDLLLRFQTAGAKIVRLPIFGGGFRVYDEQLTSSELDTLGAEEMRRLRHRCHGRDVTRWEIAQGLRAYMIEHTILDRSWQMGLVRPGTTARAKAALERTTRS